jgi:hypothetical protein
MRVAFCRSAIAAWTMAPLTDLGRCLEGGWGTYAMK